MAEEERQEAGALRSPAFGCVSGVILALLVLTLYVVGDEDCDLKFIPNDDDDNGVCAGKEKKERQQLMRNHEKDVRRC